MSSALLNKVTLERTSALSEAEVLLRNVPRDNFAGNLSSILDKIKNGKAQLFHVNKDGVNVGYFVSEIHGKEFWILSVKVTSPIYGEQSLVPYLENHAKEIGCESIVFQTVRAGLIERSLANGYYISSVKMRKIL